MEGLVSKCIFRIFLFKCMLILNFTTGFDSNFCSGKTDGYYTDIADCTGYYHCGHSVTNYYNCPDGTQWDQTIVNCVYLTTCTPSTPTAETSQRSYYFTVLKQKKHGGTPIDSVWPINIIDCVRFCTLRGTCQAFNFLDNTTQLDRKCEIYGSVPDLNILLDVSDVTFGYLQ